MNGNQVLCLVCGTFHQFIQQIIYPVLIIKRLQKQRMPFLILRLWLILPFPVLQQMPVAAKGTVVFVLVVLEPLEQGAPCFDRRYRLMRLLGGAAVIAYIEIGGELFSRLFQAQIEQAGGEVYLVSFRNANLLMGIDR